MSEERDLEEKFRELEERATRVTWLPASSSVWNVRLLDVGKLTGRYISTSFDKQAALNVSELFSDDGTRFIGEKPLCPRVISTSLTYRLDRMLADGVLHAPEGMEHKWALFFHQGKIICLRSWSHKVFLIGHVRQHDGVAEVTQIEGAFEPDDCEDPEFTVAWFDFLVNSHALKNNIPILLPAGMEEDPQQAGMWCMSRFGNLAHIATPYRHERLEPKRPLRTISMLHIAVARENHSAIDRALAMGVPIDLRNKFGATPMQWALGDATQNNLAFLLSRGASIEMRDDDGYTPLITAIQWDKYEHAAFLIKNGADLHGRDKTEFTPLFWAVKCRNAAMVELLLKSGANPQLGDRYGRGNPKEYAVFQKYDELLLIFDRYGP